jgi:hypothetical protein
VIPASHSCKIVVLNDRENFFSMLGYEKLIVPLTWCRSRRDIAFVGQISRR